MLLPSPLSPPPDIFTSFQSLRTRRRMICVIAVLYGFAIAFFVHSLSTQAVPKVVLGPMPRPSRKMVPPPPPPKHILEDAYRAAEKEARRAAMEEAPKLKEMEALRQTREANKERRLLERWQNATRNVERKEKKMAERKRIADAKRAAELHMTLDELHAHDEQMLLRAKARADLADWLERFNSTGNASSAAATSTVSTSGGGDSSSSSDGGSSSNTALLASAAQCLDGTTAAFVFADRSIRRELVRQLAEEAVRGSRPFSMYKFLLAGVLDQARVLWHAILDAEIKGVTAVLPEPVLTALGTGAGASAEASVASLDTVWDLDLYVLLMQCYAGIVVVRPGDVDIAVEYGVPLRQAKLDTSELKKRVGRRRVLVGSMTFTAGAEATMMTQLIEILTSVARAGNASASATVTGASPDLASTFARLAQSMRPESQLAAAMMRSLSHPAARGAPMAPPHSPAPETNLALSWVDHLWRTHRRALAPSWAVATQAAKALSSLHAAAAALDISGGGGPRRMQVISARLLRDPSSAVAAAAATALAALGIPPPLQALSAQALDELDAVESVERTPPMHVIETVEKLGEKPGGASGAVSDAASRRRVLLLLMPFDLPAMPLAVGAGWAKQLPTFTLPMLLQSTSAPQLWQSSLNASLRQLYSQQGLDGTQRWLQHATEISLSVFADRTLGSFASSSFHSVALIRCDAQTHAPEGELPAASPVGLMSGGAVTPADVRLLFFSDLLKPRRRWRGGQPPDPRSPDARSSSSHSQRDSFTSDSMRLACPAFAGELTLTSSPRTPTVLANAPEPRLTADPSTDTRLLGERAAGVGSSGAKATATKRRATMDGGHNGGDAHNTHNTHNTHKNGGNSHKDKRSKAMR